MSCAIREISSSFGISEVYRTAALTAIKNLVGNETCGFEGHRHFMWINDSAQFLDADSLEDALKVWRWEAYRSEEGRIEEITFIGENLGDEDLLFTVLAPYVDDESSIVVAGEDGTVWRWHFSNGTVRRQKATLVFGDEFQ